MKKRMVVAAALWACALLCALIPHAWLAAHVSRGLMRFLGSLCAYVPFPVVEPLFLVALALALVCLARALVRCVHTRSASPLGRWALNAVTGVGALALLYVLIWSPVSRTGVIDSAVGHTRAELKSLCDRLTEQANALREALPAELSYERERIPQRAEAAMGADVCVKAARYPEWMRALNITGICFPFTGEAIVNLEEPLLSLPFAACHEAAHQLGYGREDEANYAAYQACLRGDRFFRYSGTMYALYYAMDALRTEDTAAWLDGTKAMSAAVHGDYYSMNGFLNAEVSQRAQRMNLFSDAFLRLSGQDGLKSYGKVVDLLLANPRVVGSVDH